MTLSSVVVVAAAVAEDSLGVAAVASAYWDIVLLQDPNVVEIVHCAAEDEPLEADDMDEDVVADDNAVALFVVEPQWPRPLAVSVVPAVAAVSQPVAPFPLSSAT